MAESSLALFEPGSLGTCWYGKYHYLEPWVGCGHDCHYCYARWRSPVINALQKFSAAYHEPTPLLPAPELPRRVADGVKANNVSIVKLCRYTDILNAAFVKSGLAGEILSALAKSQVKRIIVTTKGLPDARLLALMRSHKTKFSYNAAARPAAELPLEPNLPSLTERLAAAAALKKDGVLTTIHLDPIVAGIDDEAAVLRPFLHSLLRLGLRRVMFSYLLLSDNILTRLKEKLPPQLYARITSAYDLSHADQYLPNQSETASYSTRATLKRESVSRFAAALRESGFDFVLCSLKSTPGPTRGAYQDAHPCDGTFYA